MLAITYSHTSNASFFANFSRNPRQAQVKKAQRRKDSRTLFIMEGGNPDSYPSAAKGLPTALRDANVAKFYR